MSELFSSDFFESLSSLKLAMHLRLEKGRSGSRKSSARGASVEFSDFREYLPGDDVRKIDWNVYGRLDRLYLKQFMEEQEATYHLFVDSSRSMDFGQEKKSVMALRIAGALSWLILGQMDRVFLHAICAEQVYSLHPGRGRSSFHNILTELEQISFSGNTDLERSVRRCQIAGRGVSIVLSDFLDVRGVDGLIRYLTFQKQEILLIQILSREELDFDEEGTLRLIDSETRDDITIAMTGQSIRLYEESMAKHQQTLMRLSRKYGCVYERVVSDEPIGRVLLERLANVGFLLRK